MARIRTVKPELWEDELVGTLSRDARLLFIATWNLADDEGLLRWTPAYIKSAVFMYDEDLGVDQVQSLMTELSSAGVVFPYRGGVAQQRLAVIPNFRKHQKINRPQPSRLPPPSLQNTEVRYMYGRRDGFVCHLCARPITERPVKDDNLNLSIDHLVPQSEGGQDYPSNLKAAHNRCNKGRGNRDLDSFSTSHSDSPQRTVTASVAHGEIHSLNDSVTNSRPDQDQDQGSRNGRDHHPRARPEVAALITRLTGAADDESWDVLDKILRKHKPKNPGGYLRTMHRNGHLAAVLDEVRADRIRDAETATRRAHLEATHLARDHEPRATPEQGDAAREHIQAVLGGIAGRKRGGEPVPLAAVLDQVRSA